MQTLNGAKIGDLYELLWGTKKEICIVENIKVADNQQYMEDADKGLPCVYLRNIGRPPSTRNVLYEYTWRDFTRSIGEGSTRLVSRI